MYFEKGKDAPNIVISQGSGGHAYIFAELAYLMHLRGYNVFIMPKHGGQTINKLVIRHADALAQISNTFSDKIGYSPKDWDAMRSFILPWQEAS